MLKTGRLPFRFIFNTFIQCFSFSWHLTAFQSVSSCSADISTSEGHKSGIKILIWLIFFKTVSSKLYAFDSFTLNMQHALFNMHIFRDTPSSPGRGSWDGVPPLSRPGMGYPPPKVGQTHTYENITSCHTPYAGGKKL